MAKHNIDITIVIPALREEKRIGRTLEKLASFLHGDETFSVLQTEVIVVAVDGGDKTLEVAKSFAKKFDTFRTICPGRPLGKGRDVKEGMLAAHGNTVVFMDADLATPLSYLPKLYKQILAGADVAIGTRNLRKHHEGLLRRALSNIGNMAYRVLGGVWVEDSQCGFKMFTRESSKLCFSKLTIMKWGFDMEVLAIAKANKRSIKTVRIENWRHVEGGNFDGRVIVNASDSLIDLGKIFINRIRGKYIDG